MVTDYQTHLLPRDYFEGILGRDAYPRARRVENGYDFEPSAGVSMPLGEQHFDLEIQFASMDSVGIDRMVSSPGVACEVGHLDLSEAQEIVARSNEETARAQRQHPERFGGLAMLPLQSTEAALHELDRAILDLGLEGVCMLSNVGGKPLVSPTTMPIFKRLDELRIPLFLHPARVSGAFAPELGSPVEAGLTWMWETSQAALSLITTGVLDDCPHLIVVHPHLGGVLPYPLGRIEIVDRASATANSSGHLARSATANQRPIREYLEERFYVDTVGATPGALPFAARTYGLSRILFATDYPWLPVRKAPLDYVYDELPPEEAAVVLDNKLPGLDAGEEPTGPRAGSAPE